MSHSPDYSLKLAVERRLADRLPVAIAAEALEIGGARLPITLRDFSHQGAMFDCEHHWTVGARVWLFLPSGLDVNARIVWARGGRHGCRFLRDLDEAERHRACGAPDSEAPSPG